MQSLLQTESEGNEVVVLFVRIPFGAAGMWGKSEAEIWFVSMVEMTELRLLSPCVCVCVCVCVKAGAGLAGNRGRNVFIWRWPVRLGEIVKGELLNLENALKPLAF